jgi:hypothetical protein
VLIERLSLWLLVPLVVVSLLLAFTFIATEALRWSIFPRIGERFFILTVPTCAVAIVVLGVFNIALNQGILASAEVARRQVTAGLSPRLAILLGLGVVGVLGLLGGVLFLVNRHNIESKLAEVEQEITALARSNAPALRQVARWVEARSRPDEIVKELGTLSSTSPYFRNLYFIVPLRRNGRALFKRVTQWANRNDTLFDVEGDLYAPNRFELAYLRRALGDRRRRPEIGLFVKRPDIKVLYPVKDAEHRTVLFLLSEGHTYGAREDK